MTRKEARKVPCPVCGAKQYRACREFTRGPGWVMRQRKANHIQRVRAAEHRARVWRSPDKKGAV